MKWSEAAWSESQGIYNRIVDMPFIQGLIDGTLPLDNFKFYIQQDSNYLEHFGRALSLIAARGPAQYVLDYLKFAEGAIVVENALHAGYFNQYGISGKAALSPACHYYTSYLLSSASLAQAEVAMAAVLPCFWIYKEVGDYIYKNQRLEGNPYQSWINTYAGEDFGELVKKAISISDAVAEKCSPAQRESMTEAFVNACRLEWLFWDSAWRQEKWEF